MWGPMNVLWNMKLNRTRPGVNYAKDWFDQLFLIPILVWLIVKDITIVITMGQPMTIFLCIRPFAAW